MRKVNVLYVMMMALLAISAVACKRKVADRDKVQGVWELISTRPLLADGSVDESGEHWQMMKIISKSHFMFVEQKPDRPKIAKDAKGFDSSWRP